MPETYEVVQDLNEISALNERLATRLAQTFRVEATRVVTSPGGQSSRTVYFEYEAGHAVRAWAPKIGRDKLVNMLLIGEPGATKPLEITVQLNFPRRTYSRRNAGVFIRDQIGAIFIAHRGKLAKGKAGLKKEKVLREFASQCVEAEDGGRSTFLVLISGLDDPALADRLWRFAEEAREVAIKLGKERNEAAAPVLDRAKVKPKNRASSRAPRTSRTGMMKLRAYFDEYAGTGHTAGHGGGDRTVEHGDVVKALEAYVRNSGECQKAQAIDLAVVATEKVALFEVKTSASTTDVYTGVGQLLIHGECISELLGVPVHRFLVLPTRPAKAEHARHVECKGEMDIITYRRDSGGYVFERGA